MLADTGPRSAIASREVVPPASSYVDVSYGAKSGQWFRLWTPTTSAPAGGWPVLLFVQLNYFLSTNPAAINPQFRDNMLAAGIAVASAGVNPSYLTTGTYDAVNNGKFPSHIKDVKTALRVLQAGAGTYGIDAARTFVGGHSSAGYCAWRHGHPRPQRHRPHHRRCRLPHRRAPTPTVSARSSSAPDQHDRHPRRRPDASELRNARQPLRSRRSTAPPPRSSAARRTTPPPTSPASTSTRSIPSTRARLRPIRYHYSGSDWVVPAALNVPRS